MARSMNVQQRCLLWKMLQNSRRRRSVLQNNFILLRKRRQLMLQLCFLTTLLILSRNNATNNVRFRSCRRLQRREIDWFDHVWNTYSNARFKKTFRVSKDTFLYILGKIEHDLQRQTVAEDPISPAFRLAVCLYRLARGDYFYTIAEMVDKGRSTVSTIVDEVTEAIMKNLWQEHVSAHFPNNKQQFREKMLDMEERWQFPCCWAAIDGCHIPLRCPDGGLAACKDYHNFKNFYSIVLMAMVDAKYRFIWGSCGFPGNSHDSIIFQSTQLWTNISEGQGIPSIGKDLGGVTVPPLVLGDSAFPFQTWLMKPFTNAVLSPQESYFNYRLSRARMTTGCAYGKLKGRWRVLLRKCVSPPEKVRTVALTCIVLHNICIKREDTLSNQLDLTIDPETNERRPREVIREILNMRNCQKVPDNSRQAARIRDALTQMLWQEKQGLDV